MKVEKRDGRIQDFKFSKIENAIRKVFESKPINSEVPESFLETVRSFFDKLVQKQDAKNPDYAIPIEEIQDDIRNLLIKANKYEAAESFILYRKQREDIREKKSWLTKEIAKKLKGTSIENQNANVDEMSFGGRVGEASRVVTKDYALKNLVSKMAKDNHLNNEIYLHDLDSYAIGDHNCADGDSWVKINYKGTIKLLKIKDLANLLGLSRNKIIDTSDMSIMILSRNGWTRLNNLSCRETDGTEQIFIFKTRSGLPIKVTEKHRLPVIKEGKNAECILEAKDIQIGDSLLDIENVQLSANELSESFLDLTKLNGNDIDIRITNLSPLKSYLSYKYGICFAHKHTEYNFELTPDSKTIHLSDFNKLINEYPISFDVLSQLRIKNSGSKHDYPLHIPFSTALAKIYAYIYADGGVYWSKEKQIYQLTFTNSREDIVDDFIKCYEEVFGYKLNKSYPQSHQKTNNVIRVIDGSRIIVKLFKDFAGGKKFGAADMSIPDFIINGDDTIKYAFLSAAIDTDGALSKCITYSSCSPRYCEQISLILQSLGFHPHITQYGHAGDVYRFGKKSGHRNFDSYNITVNRNDEIYELYTNLNTFKYNDSYSYMGISNKFKENKITTIQITNEKQLVYDVETEDHWFILNNYVSHNCLSIPFDDLLSKGFNTRQTDVRPANSINTAFQLVAVIFQLQSLQQFGGVSSTHLDWTMVPYVRKSFYKHYLDGLKYIDQSGTNQAELNDKLSIDDAVYTKNEKVYTYALNMCQKELKQAVEGMYHNLK